MSLAPSNWCIKVEDKVYGPYSEQDMASFVSQGRLSPSSAVSPAGAAAWREARHYSTLARHFDGQGAGGSRAFGKAGTDDSPTELRDGALANIVTIFDVTHGTVGRIEYVLRSLGDGFRLTDNVWCTKTAHSSTGVKNIIVPHLSPREFVFVIDASRGRTTWHNTLPELHSRLTRTWIRNRA